MNIYNLLSVNKHNPHYLNRYISFINKRNINRILEHKENHHILPQSLFPEYDKEKWNKIFLTPREHLLAHYILAKALGGKHWISVNRMLKCENPYQHRKSFNKLNSVLYETWKIESSKAQSIICVNNRKNESQEVTDSRISKWKLSHGNDKEKLERARIKGSETYKKNLELGITKPTIIEKISCPHCEGLIAVGKRAEKHIYKCKIAKDRLNSLWCDMCKCRKTKRHKCPIQPLYKFLSDEDKLERDRLANLKRKESVDLYYSKLKT